MNREERFDRIEDSRRSKVEYPWSHVVSEPMKQKNHTNEDQLAVCPVSVSFLRGSISTTKKTNKKKRVFFFFQSNKKRIVLADVAVNKGQRFYVHNAPEPRPQ